MTDRGFPFAAYDSTDMGIDHPSFDFDNRAFGRLAVRARAQAQCGRKRLVLVALPRSHLQCRRMTPGLAETAARLGLRLELAEPVASGSGGAAVKVAVTARFAAPDPPDGLLVGSTTAAMSAVARTEACGLILGRDFDPVAKEAIAVLRRFRRKIILIREDLGRAGDFLARAIVATIGTRPLAERQGLDVPDTVDWGQSPCLGG